MSKLTIIAAAIAAAVVALVAWVGLHDGGVADPAAVPRPAPEPPPPPVAGAALPADLVAIPAAVERDLAAALDEEPLVGTSRSPSAVRSRRRRANSRGFRSTRP